MRHQVTWQAGNRKSRAEKSKRHDRDGTKGGCIGRFYAHLQRNLLMAAHLPLYGRPVLWEEISIIPAKQKGYEIRIIK
jgi:hypothetical protein